MDRRLLAFMLALALCVAALGLTVAYRAAYGNFPWDGGPDRVQWCGRRYYLDPGHVGADRPLTPIFRAPPLVGARVYAVRPTCGGATTELILYRSVGDAEYAVYALSGGP
jgi:hypothetical protein